MTKAEAIRQVAAVLGDVEPEDLRDVLAAGLHASTDDPGAKYKHALGALVDLCQEDHEALGEDSILGSLLIRLQAAQLAADKL